MCPQPRKHPNCSLSSLTPPCLGLRKKTSDVFSKAKWPGQRFGPQIPRIARWALPGGLRDLPASPEPLTHFYFWNTVHGSEFPCRCWKDLPYWEHPSPVLPEEMFLAFSSPPRHFSVSPFRQSLHLLMLIKLRNLFVLALDFQCMAHLADSRVRAV